MSLQITNDDILTAGTKFPAKRSAQAADLTALTALQPDDEEVRVVPGKGRYRYDVASTLTADGLYVVAPDSGAGRWIHEGRDLMVATGLLDARAFGVKANYDPATGTGDDDTEALQAAVDAAFDSGASLLLPKGNIKVTATINVPIASGTRTIRGCGFDATKIYAVGFTTTVDATSGLRAVISCAGTIASRVRVEFEDFTIDGQGDNTLIGLYLNYTTPYLSLRRVWVIGCYEGCRIGDNWLINIENCRMSGSTLAYGLVSGLHLDDSAAVVNNLRIIGGEYTSCRVYGIRILGGRNHSILGSDISGHGVYAAFVYGMSIISPYYENALGAAAAWALATAYDEGDRVKHNGLTFVCTTNHTSAAATEPGTGASWDDDWLYAAGVVIDSSQAVTIDGLDVSVWEDDDVLVHIRSSMGVVMNGFTSERGSGVETTSAGTAIYCTASRASFNGLVLQNIALGVYLKDSDVSMAAPSFGFTTVPIECFNHAFVNLHITNVAQADLDASTFGTAPHVWAHTREGNIWQQNYAQSGEAGFFGASPLTNQPASANQAALTNSTGGTRDGVLAAVPSDTLANAAAACNNNFTDLHTLLNEIRTALVNLGLIKGSA